MAYTAGQKLRASQMTVAVCTAATRPAGHSGQIAFETDTGKLILYNGSAWVYILPETGVTNAPGDLGTVTSGTYTGTRTGTANVVGVTFKAPQSGVVRIDWASGIFNSSAANYTLCSIEVRTGTTIGSGTIVLAASDNYALQASIATEIKIADWYMLSGLTPRADYNVRLMYRVFAGTGTFNRPKVLVTSAM